MRTQTTSKPSFAIVRRGLCRFAAAVMLSLAVSSGLGAGAVRATDFMPGQAYVRYTSDHLLSPYGDLVQLGDTTTDNGGQTHDIYGNLVIANPDSTISNSDYEVVGFVYSSAPARNPAP